MQSCNKRLRADGIKEASSFWGGATNPDGSLKKIAVYNTKGKKSARRKENEQRRSASKKDLKELFLERRDELEKLGRWTGPRTLSVWLQELAVRVLNGEDEAAAAGIPTVLIVVCCCILMCVFGQRSEMLLTTVEMLAVASAKDPERIRTALDQLRKDFLGADSEI